MLDDDRLEDCWKDIHPRQRGGRTWKVRLLGQVFGRLLVIQEAGTDKHGASLWLCRCTCGKEKVVQRGALKSGRVKSCGCLLAEYKKAPKSHLLRARVERADISAVVGEVTEVAAAAARLARYIEARGTVAERHVPGMATVERYQDRLESTVDELSEFRPQGRPMTRWGPF